MNNISGKPRLLFFQYKYDKHLPAFLLTHAQEHIRCLAASFDVTVIREDCDYQQVCDTYKPDITLFESGVNHPTCERLQILNARSHSGIPKIGLQHGDAFCDARAGFLSDMDHWGIETFFSISTTAAEHTPEIADQLFIWPVFVDDEICHDYGAWKSIPVFVSGNSNELYPWRRKILKIVPEHYPSLIWPHPGYQPRSVPARMLVGEDYARTINASWFVPTCGTVAKEFVRKHLEIPASKSCLLTERSPALEAAGFADMKNCVFVDEQDVLEKIGYLFQHEDELRAITDAGYQLVHSRHTLKHRDQIFQWYRLHRQLKAGEKIVQPGPFEPLAAVPASAHTRNTHVAGGGLHLSLLRQGDEKLWEGKYDEAERLYVQCMNIMRWMPEPRLRMALCSLYKGEAKKALSWIDVPIHFILCVYKAADPDPVEWAYFIVALLCLGKVDEAVKRSEQFPWLRHPELDRARCVARAIKTGRFASPAESDFESRRRHSIHRMPERDLANWTGQICIMLRACGRPEIAATLMHSCEASAADSDVQSGGTPASGERIAVRAPGQEIGRPDKSIVSFFQRRAAYRDLRLKVRASIAARLRGLESRYGYFLPYSLSESRNNEFYKTIRNLASGESIRTALLIGAAKGNYATEAVLAGLRENGNHPSVYCLSDRRNRFKKTPKPSTREGVHWFGGPSLRGGSTTQVIAKVIDAAKNQNRLGGFDLLHVDGGRFKARLDAEDIGRLLTGVRFVILQDLNSPCSHQLAEALLRDASYILVNYGPESRGGFSIFSKHAPYNRGKESGDGSESGVHSGAHYV
jgi:hypothetical protein